VRLRNRAGSLSPPYPRSRVDGVVRAEGKMLHPLDLTNQATMLECRVYGTRCLSRDTETLTAQVSFLKNIFSTACRTFSTPTGHCLLVGNETLAEAIEVDAAV